MHDYVFAIIDCAKALRGGADPSQVASALDDIAERLQEDLGKPTTDHGDLATLQARIDDITAAHLDIAGRFDNLHTAMREAAKREALHPSVRFLADTIALNLGAPTGGQNG